MHRFFKSEKAIEQFLELLNTLCCPFCGTHGTLVRHGYIRGYISEREEGIRAWRIFCDPDSPHGTGCGRAPSIRLGDTLMRRCFTAMQLARFIQALRQGQSVRAAWKHCGIALSLRSGYRLFHRLNLCQSILRTHLNVRAPPPEKKNAGSPFLQVLIHLKEAFGDKNAIRAYQETLQRDFLAIA